MQKLEWISMNKRERKVGRVGVYLYFCCVFRETGFEERGKKQTYLSLSVVSGNKTSHNVAKKLT